MNAELDHVQLTIDELAFRIGKLQDTMRGLHELKALRTEGKCPPSAPRQRSIPVFAPKSLRGGSAVQTPGREPELNTKGTKETKATGVGTKVRGVIEELVGDFDLKKVAGELPDEDLNSVRNAISYLLRTGVLKGADKRGWYRQAGAKGGEAYRRNVAMREEIAREVAAGKPKED